MGRECRDDAGAQVNIGLRAIGLALDLPDPLSVPRFQLPVARCPLPAARLRGLATANLARERTLYQAQDLEGGHSGQALGH